jgi:hypothetical protein
MLMTKPPRWALWDYDGQKWDEVPAANAPGKWLGGHNYVGPDVRLVPVGAKQECPDCHHPHLPMPKPFKTRGGIRIDPVCDWPMGPEACDCHRRSLGKAR